MKLIDVAIAGVIAGVGGAAIACVISLPVMWLWNSTLPELFGVHRIDFVTALKLAVLCDLLFVSHSRGSKGGDE